MATQPRPPLEPENFHIFLCDECKNTRLYGCSTEREPDKKTAVLHCDPCKKATRYRYLNSTRDKTMARVVRKQDYWREDYIY
jgi:hypothetical protein